MSDEAAREAMDASARWIARNIPRRAYEGALPTVLGHFRHEFTPAFSMMQRLTELLPRTLAKARDAARTGDAAFDAWEQEIRKLAGHLGAIRERAHRNFFGILDPLTRIDRAYDERLRAGEALVEDFGAVVPVSLHAVLSSALAGIDAPRVPAMPEGLPPGLMVRASPEALRTLLARALERLCRRDLPVTLAYREEPRRAHLVIRQPGAREAPPPDAWVEGILLECIARDAGAQEHFGFVGWPEAMELVFACEV